tara:strand:- start:734 stop:1660 length:927 start_codon:yes stop_codon:yes gene_type:complete
MKKLFFVFIFAMVLISSCGGEDEPQTETSSAFIGGTNGISFSFVEGAPLNEFAAGQDMPVKISLRNDGEYDLASNSLEVRLWGLDMAAYGLSSDYKKVSSELRGIEKGLIEEGAETRLDMGTLNYDGTIVNSLDVTLRSEVCYPYKTRASLNFCISSSAIENVGEESTCDIAGNKVASGSVSSSPVQLNSVTEQFEGSNNLVFKFNIANSGSGKVYKSESSCTELIDAPTQRLNEEIVHVTLPEGFSCFFMEGAESNEGDIKLSDSEKVLTCYLEVENQGFSFERNVDLILDYRYIETSSVDFTILES